MTTRRTLLASGVAGAALLATRTAWAAYPERPIRFIVPFPPGGPADGIGRLIATHLAERLGQPFVVDNRPGAGTLIGADFVAKSRPDGYTLLLGTSSMNMLLLRKQGSPIDARKDFVPVSTVAETIYGFYTNPSAPFKTVPELIAYAKANPGKVTCGNTGTGTTPHLIVEAFNTAAGVKILSVPYKGGAPMAVGLMGGEVMMSCDTVGNTNPLVREGKINIMATSGTTRAAVFPNTPTIAETVPNFVALGMTGIFAPAGTPKDVIDHLNAAMVDVVKKQEVKDKFGALSMNARSTSATEYHRLVVEEIEKWSKVIRDSGVVIE